MNRRSFIAGVAALPALMATLGMVAARERQAGARLELTSQFDPEGGWRCYSGMYVEGPSGAAGLYLDSGELIISPFPFEEVLKAGAPVRGVRIAP